MTSHSDRLHTTRGTTPSQSPQPPSSPPAPEGATAYAGPASSPDEYELDLPGESGGEGTLYRARYRGGLSQPLEFAIKAHHRPAGPGFAWPTEDDLQQWRDQTALLRHVNTPHLVRLHDAFAGPPPHAAGEADPDPHTASGYTVMEWIEGPRLDEVIGDSPAKRSNLAARVGYVRDVADAITTLHSRTLTGGNPALHRDIKPSNCIVHPERGVVLVDVSSLRLITRSADAEGLHSPTYAAPEVLASPHTPRHPSADLYSLGALAAYCLTGRAPSTGSGLRSQLISAAEAAGATGAETVADLICAMLAPDPSTRPDDALWWAQQLGRVAAPKPRRPLVVAAAATAITLGVGGLVAATALTGAGEAPTREAAPLPPATAGTPDITAGPAALAPAAATAARQGTARYPHSTSTWTGRNMGTGTITAPVDGDDVPGCAYIEGTAHVPPDVRLVTAMRNRDASDGWYVEHIYAWDNPARVADWSGPQWFGAEGTSEGQHYEVALIAVPRSTLLVADTGTDEEFNALVTQGPILDSVIVRRIPGLGPDRNCGLPIKRW